MRRGGGGCKGECLLLLIANLSFVFIPPPRDMQALGITSRRVVWGEAINLTTMFIRHPCQFLFAWMERTVS